MLRVSVKPVLPACGSAGQVCRYPLTWRLLLPSASRAAPLHLLLLLSLCFFLPSLFLLVPASFSPSLCSTPSLSAFLFLPPSPLTGWLPSTPQPAQHTHLAIRSRFSFILPLLLYSFSFSMSHPLLLLSRYVFSAHHPFTVCFSLTTTPYCSLSLLHLSIPGSFSPSLFPDKKKRTRNGRILSQSDVLAFYLVPLCLSVAGVADWHYV